MSNPSIRESECFHASTIEAREKLYHRAVEDDGLGRMEGRVVWVAEKYISRVEADLRRYRRMILVIIGAWLLFAMLAFARDYQQSEAYRLLENEYARHTGKLPPKVKP